MKLLKPLLLSVLVFVTYAFLAIKAPYLHKKYLRSSAGAKTIMITKGRSGGSGFFVDVQGKTLILTNKHVCRISKDGYLDVHLPNTKESLRRKILALSDDHDLCLVQGVQGYNNGFKLAKSVEIGEDVAIVGHPKLHPLTISIGQYIGNRVIRLMTAINIKKEECNGKWYKPNDLMSAIYGIESKCVENFDSFQLTAYSRGGSSGSPVVNFWGNLVGVLFAGNPSDQFESYAVPLDDIGYFLQEYDGE